MGFRGAARAIAGEGPWLAAAAELGCEPAAIRAVARVESRGAAFLPSGRPPILFERHLFHRLTAGRFDAEAPSLSAPSPGGYGAGGEAQYARLEAAARLDRTAALGAASWGRFQILGLNAGLCGWPDAESFVADLCDDEAAQLDAFVGFVRGARLDRHLRARDWAGFARGYNGPGYAAGGYDAKLAAAWAEEAVGGAPGGGTGDFRVTSVAALQRALAHLGAAPGPIDGLFGPRTRAAILRFERQCRLPETGAAGPALMAAAQAVYYALGGPARG
ncbi:MAG: N-acetylmuramidase domain-containing protein [Pseudomonadota bacterium]|nr:N-acetylmuramidase domain-containing protein [Pseudomonadota bacterium]